MTAILAAVLAVGCSSTPNDEPTSTPGLSPSVAPTAAATPGQFLFGEGTVEVSGTNGTCNGPVAMGLAVTEDGVTVLIETGVSVQPDGTCVDEGLGGPVDFEFDGPPPELDGSWRAAGDNPVIQWDIQGRLGIAASALSGVILVQGSGVGGTLTIRGLELTPGSCDGVTQRLCPTG